MQKEIVSFDPQATNGARTPVPLNELSTAQAAQDVANEIGATQLRIGNPNLEYDGYQGGSVAPFWGLWNNKWISLSQLANQKKAVATVDLPITKVAGKISKVVFSQSEGKYVIDSPEDAPKDAPDQHNPFSGYGPKISWAFLPLTNDPVKALILERLAQPGDFEALKAKLAAKV